MGEATPIQYSEGGVSVTMYPTTDRIVLPEQDETAEARLQKPAARPAAGQVPVEAEPDVIAQAEQEEPAAAAESGADPRRRNSRPLTEAETETASMQPEAESAPESAVETGAAGNGKRAGKRRRRKPTHQRPLAYQPVSEKAVAGIASAAEAQAIAEANAQASLCHGQTRQQRGARERERRGRAGQTERGVFPREPGREHRDNAPAPRREKRLIAHVVQREQRVFLYSGFLAGFTPTESMGRFDHPAGRGWE